MGKSISVGSRAIVSALPMLPPGPIGTRYSAGCMESAKYAASRVTTTSLMKVGGSWKANVGELVARRAVEDVAVAGRTTGDPQAAARVDLHADERAAALDERLNLASPEVAAHDAGAGQRAGVDHRSTWPAAMALRREVIGEVDSVGKAAAIAPSGSARPAISVKWPVVALRTSRATVARASNVRPAAAGDRAGGQRGRDAGRRSPPTRVATQGTASPCRVIRPGHHPRARLLAVAYRRRTG